MNRGESFLAFLGGVLAGLAGGFFGVGGGIILVPLLTGVFRLGQHRAHGTSLAAIGATAVTSLAVYASRGHVAWGTAVLIALGSVATARYGARWAARTPTRALRRAFAGLLVLVALRILWKAPGPTESFGPSGAALVGSCLLLGSLVGLLAGFMGGGGGVLVVPALTLIAGLGQQLAQGTSLAVILVTAPAGAWEHSRHGNVFWRIVPGLAAGAMVGGPAASWLAHRVPERILSEGFALFLVATALYMWLRAGQIPQGTGAEAPA
jgi:hypothetical protein